MAKQIEVTLSIICANGHDNGTLTAKADTRTAALEAITFGDELQHGLCSLPACRQPLKVDLDKTPQIREVQS